MSGMCLVISGGEIMDSIYYKELSRKADCVICADGGARSAMRLGIVPDIVMGDFDTLSEDEIEAFIHEDIKIIRYPREKEYTDTHLCIIEAINRGFTEIIMIGALGGRLDHSLANIMLLALPEAAGTKIKISDEDQDVYLIRDNCEITGNIGDTLSMFPLSESVKGISTKGLKYPLEQGEFIMGIPKGISNQMLSDSAEVRLEEGSILVIQYKTDLGKPQVR